MMRIGNWAIPFLWKPGRQSAWQIKGICLGPGAHTLHSFLLQPHVVEFSLFTIILHGRRIKVVLNEVSEKESDPCSGAQMLHLCKQHARVFVRFIGKGNWQRKHQLLLWPSKPVRLALWSSQRTLLKTKKKSIPFRPLPAVGPQSEPTWLHLLL